MGKFDSLKARNETNPAAVLLAEFEKEPAPPALRLQATLAPVKEDGTENKTARLELLLKPSTKAGLKAAAKAEGRSVNDIVNRICEDYLNRRA